MKCFASLSYPLCFLQCSMGLYSVVSFSKSPNQHGGFDIRFNLGFSTGFLEGGRNVIGFSVSGTFSMKLSGPEGSTVRSSGSISNVG